MAATTTWKNRIVGSGEEDPSQLLAHPANWRIHPTNQREVLTGVLDEVGWVDQIIVNQQTGHVINGHLRVSVALSRGATSVPVVYVDLTPEEERLILATLDTITGMAGTDSDQLATLLEDISTQDASLSELLAELHADASKSRLGSPAVPSVTDGATRMQVIRPVIYGADVMLFERAMAATGIRNRADALMEICRAYLGETDDQEGQLDALLQSLAAS